MKLGVVACWCDYIPAEPQNSVINSSPPGQNGYDNNAMMIFFPVELNKKWMNSQFVGDLRRHDAKWIYPVRT